jgi:hypothetical protein
MGVDVGVDVGVVGGALGEMLWVAEGMAYAAAVTVLGALGGRAAGKALADVLTARAQSRSRRQEHLMLGVPTFSRARRSPTPEVACLTAGNTADVVVWLLSRGASIVHGPDIALAIIDIDTGHAVGVADGDMVIHLAGRFRVVTPGGWLRGVAADPGPPRP